VTRNYFESVPPDALGDPRIAEVAQTKLGKSSPIFTFTPISDTPVSKFLRLSGVQHIVSITLFQMIWQPFLSEGLKKSNSSLLRSISEKLSVSHRRGEVAWRALTFQALDAFATDFVPSSPQAKSTVSSTVEAMVLRFRPLIQDSDMAKLERDLAGIVNTAIKLWKDVQKDSCRIELETAPSQEWQAAWDGNIEYTLQDLPIRSPAADTESFCLFPRILGKPLEGDTEVLYQGLALFAESPALAIGSVELEQTRDEIRQWYSKRGARRASMSPTQTTHGQPSQFPNAAPFT